MSNFLLDSSARIVYTTICKENYFTGGVFYERGKEAKKYRCFVANSGDVFVCLLYTSDAADEARRSIFEDYVLNDYSLSEIAAEQGMSRQGVHDIVKRCSKELEHYEDTLHLIEKFRRTKEHVNQIHEIAMEVRETKDVEQIAKIEALSNCILDML